MVHLLTLRSIFCIKNRSYVSEVIGVDHRTYKIVWGEWARKTVLTGPRALLSAMRLPVLNGLEEPVQPN